MSEPRSPGDVPDVDPRFVLDTDGDGRFDTSLSDDGVDLILGTDLDADGIVDEILRIGPDGVLRTELLDDLP
ncbi:MAG TPA: hypothetical protein VGE11_23085 [Pseudonocardia sp.]